MRRRVYSLYCVTTILLTTAMAGTACGGGGVLEHLWGPSGPPTLTDVARMIDHIQEKLLNQGTVVIKQPDVWSQARMTKLRQEYEDTMALQLHKFEPQLSARIARSDAAGLASETALGAALSPFPATGTSPSVISSNSELVADRKEAMGLIVTGGQQSKTTFADPTKTPTADFTLLTTLTQSEKPTTPGVDMKFGLEPNIMLDEKSDYINHLHRLRRINLGDDNADSAGYGLYLMRVPLSIQPGDRTKKGFGAITNLTVRHDFHPRFLPATYRNLVINDLVDKLTPVIHELIRSGTASHYAALLAEGNALPLGEERQNFEAELEDVVAKAGGRATFTLNRSGPRMNAIAPSDLGRVFQMKNLLLVAVDLQAALGLIPSVSEAVATQAALVQLQGQGRSVVAGPSHRAARAQVAKDVAGEPSAPPPPSDVTGAQPSIDEPDPAKRAAKQAAKRAADKVGSWIPYLKKVRLTDVRSLLRNELEAAYDLTDGHCKDKAILRDVPNVEQLVDAFYHRDFEGEPGSEPDTIAEANDFESAYENFTKNCLPGNVSKRPLGVLAWGIVLEAGLLNRHLHEEMKQTKGDNNYTVPADVDGMAFYAPEPPPEVEQAFEEYIRARWPMITFALEPVVDQQNIDDAFTRRRELQLAIAFALTSGRISFRQAITYTRQLQYEAQTIALNQTVNAFANGNDTFGWRVSPRYQTPPEESNLRAVTNLLLRGGPGPNWERNNARIEPGMRELTAVVVMPSFVPGVRIDVSSDWFRLHDPDERTLRTARTVEIGREINETRDCLEAACKYGKYRAEDVERLRIRLHQLETMLPMQTHFVRVPYENTLGGFALFSQGKTDLVPELLGFDGIDYIDKSKPVDLIVYGKNFSLYETSVVVGGKSLLREGVNTFVATNAANPPESVVANNLTTPIRDNDGNIFVVTGTSSTPVKIPDPGTYLIQSREVMRVRIPEGVQTVKRSDGTEAVELYVATPTGVSNRLSIPLAPPQQEVPRPIGVTLTPGTATLVDTELAISYKAGDDNSILLNERLPIDTNVRISANGQDGSMLLPKVVDVTLSFTLPSSNAANSKTIDAPFKIEGVSLAADANSYVLSSDDLEELADKLEKRLKASGLPVQGSRFTTTGILLESQIRDLTFAPPPGTRVVNPLTTTNNLTVSYRVVAPLAALTPASGSAAPGMSVGGGRAPALAKRPERDAKMRRTSLDAPEAMAAGPEGLAARPLLPGTAVDMEPAAEASPLPFVPRSAPRLPGLTPPVPSQGDEARREPGVLRVAPPMDSRVARTLIQDAAGSPASSSSVASTTGQTPATSNAGTTPAPVINVAPPALQSAPAVVVLPQAPAAAPRVNVSVPITNYAKPPRKGLFHREPPSPQNPRRSILQRVINGP